MIPILHTYCLQFPSAPATHNIFGFIHFSYTRLIFLSHRKMLWASTRMSKVHFWHSGVQAGWMDGADKSCQKNMIWGKPKFHSVKSCFVRFLSRQEAVSFFCEWLHATNFRKDIHIFSLMDLNMTLIASSEKNFPFKEKYVMKSL